MKKISLFLLAKSIGLYINTLSFLHLSKATILARAFLTEPRSGKLKETKLPAVLQEAKKETFYYDDHFFPVYSWKGNETTILLIHGWESNASRWEKLLPHLKKSGSTIIAIDAPAHGLSSGIEFSIPQYAEFIHKTVEKYQPKYLIGHSVGGKTCLYYQHLYPKNSIQKIVLLGAPSDFKVIFENYINMLSLNTIIYKELEKQCVAFYKTTLDQFSVTHFGRSIQVNGLIAHDIEDDVVSIKEAKKIANTWKNAAFIETKGLGHSMHNDQLYQKVHDFLFSE